MSTERIHTRIQDQARTQVRQKTRRRTRLRQMSRARIQAKVFELSPHLVKDYFTLLKELGTIPEDPSVDPEFSEAEGLLELDADMDITDEDELSVEDTPAAVFEHDLGILLESSVAFAQTPVFDVRTAYIISAIERNKGFVRCRLEEPAWFSARLPAPVKDAVIKMRHFLTAVADWLEEEKQDFLSTPSAAAFSHGESMHLNKPVVLQEGFLERINFRVPEDFQLDPPAFSRLLDKIWLLWPRWNMPLKYLFSEECKRTWLVEICTGIYRQATRSWCEKLNNPMYSKDDMASIRKRPFNNLNPDEKLHFFREVLKFPVQIAETVWKEAVSRINAGQNGEE